MSVLYRVTGNCLACNTYHKIEGIGVEEDAVMFFHQEHRADAGHWFEGEPIVSKYEDKEPVKETKRYRR